VQDGAEGGGLNGLINALKPAGMTSFDVVAYLRRLLKVKKIGHCGTLDPAAAGVLPICLGYATGAAGYITDAVKSYRAELLLGIQTDTLDLDGRIVRRAGAAPCARADGEQAGDGLAAGDGHAADGLADGGPTGGELPAGEQAGKARAGACHAPAGSAVAEASPQAGAALAMPGEREMEAALRGFEGRQLQTPPMFSAVKSGGKRLYSLARGGAEVERAPREIEIYSIRLVRRVENRYIIDVSCSKGTYIRSLCQDIGERFGLPACLSFLIRTASAGMGIGGALPLERIELLHGRGELAASVIPVDAALSGYPRVDLSGGQCRRFVNGAVAELGGPGTGADSGRSGGRGDALGSGRGPGGGAGVAEGEWRGDGCGAGTGADPGGGGRGDGRGDGRGPGQGDSCGDAPGSGPRLARVYCGGAFVGLGELAGPAGGRGDGGGRSIKMKKLFMERGADVGL
jgi:tRNA U55 pseudouridine synthase TruB